jgi:Zn-dependent protease
MLETINIFFIILGWASYWIVKVPSTIKGENPIKSAGDFFVLSWKEFVLSIFGILILIFGGEEIPKEWGKISGPVTAFIAGGAIPSIFMNFMNLIVLKNNNETKR